MGYSFFTIRKLRSDEDFKQLETELSPDISLKGLFEKKFDSLQYYKETKKRKLRKNGVRAILLSFSYCEHENIDFNSWVNACRLWLSGKFIKADEMTLFWNEKQSSDSGYIRTIMIPITLEGKICYDYYFRTKAMFWDCIDSYTDMMELRFGLGKPLKHTVALSSESSRFLISAQPYASLPDPIKGETAESYYLRVRDVFLEQYIASENAENIHLKKLEKENENLHKELLPLYELTKKYGPPVRWEHMMKTALTVQYAVRAAQANGNEEELAKVQEVLNMGKNYIVKHRIQI